MEVEEGDLEQMIAISTKGLGGVTVSENEFAGGTVDAKGRGGYDDLDTKDGWSDGLW